MKTHVFRLTKGMLLKESIRDYCLKNEIKAGVVVSSVGSLTKAMIRSAGAKRIVTIEDDLEIIALNGTVSDKRIHLHMSVADDELKLFGGHLVDGCIINTTCEVILLEFDDYKFDCVYDEETNYNELLIKEIKNN